MNLCAGVTYAEPTMAVEGMRLRQLALDDGRHGCAHLGRIDVGRQQMQQCGIRQGMQRTEAIGDRTANDRIAAFWRNHALQLLTVAAQARMLRGEDAR